MNTVLRHIIYGFSFNNDMPKKRLSDPSNQPRSIQVYDLFLFAARFEYCNLNLDFIGFTVVFYISIGIPENPQFPSVQGVSYEEKKSK